MKSQFEEICQEDCKQFRDLFSRYKSKRVEDLEELHSISTLALILAQRWCEIQSNASIIAKENGLSKEQCEKFAKEDTKKEVADGVQTFNYQVNSMTNTNGQAPFLSVCMYLGETDEYKEELAMIIEEFLNQKLIFAGFVLHSETSTRGYDAVDFYDRYNITSEMLKKNIEKSLNIDKIKADYNIVIIHLPIKDKKMLIMRIIEKANKELENLRGGIYE